MRPNWPILAGLTQLTWTLQEFCTCVRCFQNLFQARPRVVKSGPAEVNGECRRHKSGESTRGGLPPPSPS